MDAGQPMRNIAGLFVFPVCLWFFPGLILFLNGCILTRDDKASLFLTDPHHIELSDSIHLARSNWPSANWWRIWNDPQLNNLIDTALKQSPGINAARMRVTEAQSGVDLSRSLASLQTVAAGQKNFTRVITPKHKAIGPWYTLGIVGIGARLSLDLWGTDRARVEAAIGKKNANIAEEAGIELDMAATIAQLYYGIQTTYQQIALLKESKAITELSLRAHTRRIERGLETRTDYENARTEQLSVEQRLVAAEGKIIQLRENLRALLGMGPHELSVIRPMRLPALQKNLPPALSFELLARRPDLLAYHWYVQASLSQIDIAKAAFYPNFDIKAFWGYTSLHIDDVFKHSFQPFSIMPGVYLPLFNGGRLKANLDATQNASKLLIEQYNQAVLNAVRDVATISSELHDLDQQAELQKQKVAAATVRRASAEAHFKRGLVSYYIAQEARQTLIAAKLAKVDIEAQRISRDIMLTKALGGGYRSEQPATRQSPNPDRYGEK